MNENTEVLQLALRTFQALTVKTFACGIVEISYSFYCVLIWARRILLALST